MNSREFSFTKPIVRIACILAALAVIAGLSGCSKASTFVGAYDLKPGEVLAGCTSLTLSFNGGSTVMLQAKPEGAESFSAQGSYTDDATSVSVSFATDQPFHVAGANWKFLKRGNALVSSAPGISVTLLAQ